MKIVYVAHPFAGDPQNNHGRVVDIARGLVGDGFVPLALQIYLPQFVDEVTDRDLALRLCLALVAISDEVRVYGEPTAGMRLEIAEARRLGIPVVAGDDKGAMALTGEPPR